VKHTKDNITLEQWYRMLKKLASDQYGFDPKVGGPSCCWKEFYHDGYSPREALDEDTYAGV